MVVFCSFFACAVVLLCSISGHFAYYRSYSNTPFFLKWLNACVRTCTISPDHLSFADRVRTCTISPDHLSLQGVSTTYLYHQHWIHMSASHHWIHMSAMAKNAPPSEVTDGLESHLRHSSLISAAAFADADALTISPAAAPAAVSVLCYWYGICYAR